MAQQVKFYSVATMPQTPTEGALYFVKNGELYKGTQRFGLGRVTNASTAEALAALKAGAARGDINVGYQGAKVYDGENWQPLGGDIEALQASWQADISNWVAGLNASGADASSYITHITTDGKGKVTAQTANFADAVRGAIEKGEASGTSNGVTVSVITTSGKVTAVNVAAPALETGTDDGTVKLGAGDVKVFGWDTVKTDISNLQAVVSFNGTGDKVVTASTVTAGTGNFTDLNVSGTADFTATTVQATSLTVDDETKATFGGTTISAIADREALAKIAAIAEVTKSSSANGVGVSVITQSGSVKDVQVAVDVTASAADIKTDAVGTKLARAKDVADAIAGLAGAMHFRGVFASLDAVTDPKNGDIILVGTKEYVYSKPGEATGQWVELGDESQVGKLTTYTGLDTSLNTAAQTLAGGINELDAKIKGMDYSAAAAEADNGVKVQITQVDGAITSVVTTVDAIESSDGIVTGEGKVVTAGAVADKIANTLAGLDATVSASNKGVEVNVVETDGKLTSATVSVTTKESMAYNETGSADVIASTKAVQTYFQENLVWLDADGQPVSEA